MFKSAIPLRGALSARAFHQSKHLTAAPISLLQYPRIINQPQTRLASTTPKFRMTNFKTPSSDPPKHEMQYFPGMTNSLPAESHEFRRVLWTGLYSQVVLMTVPVGGDIGEEVMPPLPFLLSNLKLTRRHQIHTVDQILTFTSGIGLAQVGGAEQPIKAGDMVVVPAGTKHQFLNKGDIPLVLYTVYSPAEHKATTVHKTKEEGDKEDAEGIDVAPAWSQRSKKQNEDEGWVKGE
jgi:mannose-6-phosphate isomerase-like protein (cupin superfamily)